MRRQNLKLFTGAHVTRVLFDGNRAVGVEIDTDGRRQVVKARREVLLCAGAINTPQLLMLSGIGDRDQLAEHGIESIHHAPEVGANLLDHLIVPLGFDATCETLFAAEKPLQLVNYLARRRGMLTSNVGEAYGFVRSRPDLALPDLELIFAPAPFFDEGIGEPYPGHAVVMGPILLKPKSTGTISLASADPLAKPIIDPRYLSDDAGEDRAALMEGLRITARIAESPAMRAILGGIARPAGARELTDETLERALNTLSHTLYHPVGTCRMGCRRRQRGGPAVAGPRRRRVAGGRRVGDADDHPRPHPRAVGADRREGRRPHPLHPQLTRDSCTLGCADRYPMCTGREAG